MRSGTSRTLAYRVCSSDDPGAATGLTAGKHRDLDASDAAGDGSRADDARGVVRARVSRRCHQSAGRRLGRKRRLLDDERRRRGRRARGACSRSVASVVADLRRGARVIACNLACAATPGRVCGLTVATSTRDLRAKIRLGGPRGSDTRSVHASSSRGCRVRGCNGGVRDGGRGFDRRHDEHDGLRARLAVPDGESGKADVPVLAHDSSARASRLVERRQAGRRRRLRVRGAKVVEPAQRHDRQAQVLPPALDPRQEPQVRPLRRSDAAEPGRRDSRSCSRRPPPATSR